MNPPEHVNDRRREPRPEPSRRKSRRDPHERWVEAVVLHDHTFTAMMHIMSPGRDISQEGLGLWSAVEFPVDTPVVVRIFRKGGSTEQIRFGRVRGCKTHSNWIAVGVQFAPPPPSLLPLTWSRFARRAA